MVSGALACTGCELTFSSNHAACSRMICPHCMPCRLPGTGEQVCCCSQRRGQSRQGLPWAACCERWSSHACAGSEISADYVRPCPSRLHTRLASQYAAWHAAVQADVNNGLQHHMVPSLVPCGTKTRLQAWGLDVCHCIIKTSGSQHCIAGGPWRRQVAKPHTYHACTQAWGLDVCHCIIKTSGSQHCIAGGPWRRQVAKPHTYHACTQDTQNQLAQK